MTYAHSGGPVGALCPTCCKPPTDPVERPHAVFCRSCFDAVKGDRVLRRASRPATSEDAPASAPPRAPRPVVGDWREVPGYPGREIDSGLNLRSRLGTGRLPRREPRPVRPAESYRELTYSIWTGDRSVYRTALDLYRLAFGREWEETP